jgi:hypothetical protein
MSKTIKEALSIAGVTVGGFAIAISVAMAAGLMAGKVFSDHLWPRLLVAALIVLILGLVAPPNSSVRHSITQCAC